MSLWLAFQETVEHAEVVAEEASTAAEHADPGWVVAINHAIGPYTVPIQKAIMTPIYSMFGATWHPPHHGHEIPAHVMLALLAFLLCTVGLYFFRGTLSVDKPTNRQQVLESVFEALRGMLDDIVGPYGRQYLPLIGAFAVFILVSNLMGMVPGIGAPTGNFNVTLALGLVSFGFYISRGFIQMGFGYLKHFMGGLDKGAFIIVGVIVFFFEVLSNLVRPFTLGLRLFLNIFADHQIGGVFESLVPWLVPVLLPVPLAAFVALVQTMVFIMLSMIYLAETVPHEEHDHDEHGDHHGSLAEHQIAVAAH